jgi:hypothetical protein
MGIYPSRPLLAPSSREARFSDELGFFIVDKNINIQLSSESYICMLFHISHIFDIFAKINTGWS